MAKPRVLLADDHALLLGAFEKLLAEECEIVGQVGDGRALVEAAEALKPEVIVLDIAMPLLNGLEAGRQIKHKLPSVKLKRSAASELMSAIREVMRARMYITPLVAQGLVQSLQHGDDRNPAQELTPRQREVLQLLAEGRSMKEVASVLSLTPRTVAFHKYRMMEQLRVKTTAELIQYAVKHHIV